MNAPPSMFVTLSGITMDFNPLHPEKALLPISVTPTGMIIEVIFVQSLKVLSPILIVFSGIVTLFAHFLQKNGFSVLY